MLGRVRLRRVNVKEFRSMANRKTDVVRRHPGRYKPRLPAATSVRVESAFGPLSFGVRAAMAAGAFEQPEGFMIAKQLLSPILDDEALTRGLSDPEARVLIEWLVVQTERYAEVMETDEEVADAVHGLCRRARAIGRFVILWGNRRSRGAACQLAATERFPWPLPSTDIDPCELMLEILAYEEVAD
jgi:hypothetical protein